MPVTPLPEVIADAFRRQEKACHSLGSPFTARLCELIADEGVPAGPVHQRLTNWYGRSDAGGDALPLRLTGALHYLVLSGRDDGLTGIYPPEDVDGQTVSAAVFDAIERHGDFIDGFLDSPPQTNECGRSAILLPAFLHLQARFGLPLVLSELGSSAGLNQNWHRYRYEYGPWAWGDLDSPVTLSCEWHGDWKPNPLPVNVAECAGCDIAPIPIDTTEDRLRLKSYVWPDQPARLVRLAGALAVAADHPPAITATGAADWLAQRLAEIRSSHLHVIFHTIMWQYMPADEQARAQSLIEDAGSRATAESPLAWLRFEADGQPDGAPVTLTVWDGETTAGETTPLGRGCYHGRWIQWNSAA